MARPFRWHPGSSPRRELRRAARGRIDHALRALQHEDPDEAVHEVRRAGKQLRALLRLVRESAPALYADEDRAIRDATARLSEVRDAAVALQTFDALLEDAARAAGDGTSGARFAPVRAGLQARRQDVADEDSSATTEAVRTELLELRGRVAGWRVPGEGFDVVAGGLRRTYRECRRRARQVRRDPTTEALHAWRRQVKHHRYHLELLREVWPTLMAAHEDELHQLTDLLGADHDLTVLVDSVRSDPPTFGGAELVEELAALVSTRRAELQAEAVVLGRRCFAESPAAFVERVRRYWEVAR